MSKTVSLWGWLVAFTFLCAVDIDLNSNPSSSGPAFESLETDSAWVMIGPELPIKVASPSWTGRSSGPGLIALSGSTAPIFGRTPARAARKSTQRVARAGAGMVGVVELRI